MEAVHVQGADEVVVRLKYTEHHTGRAGLANVIGVINSLVCVFLINEVCALI